MRIVCVSDTHTYGRKLEVPDGDVLIHAGDHTFRGTEQETKMALKWLDGLPHQHKLFIAGNHDFFFDDNAPESFRGWRLKNYYYDRKSILERFPSLTYLKDSEVVIDGVKFYGSPWQPWYYGWAFNFSADPAVEETQARGIWDRIPEDTNVLITHGPAQGILDLAEDGDKTGCPHLRARLNHLPKLRLHVCGHIHEAHGIEHFDAEDGSGNRVTFVNASICKLSYDPDDLNEPIVVDI